MQTPRIVKAATSADLLKMVPALAGVDPRESLVLVAFRGKRTAGALRIDLPPDSDDPDALARWAAGAVATLLRVDGLDGVAPVVYTDATFADHPEGPRRALLDLVAVLSTEAGLTLKDLLCVGGDAWARIAEQHAEVDPQPLLDLVPDDTSGIEDVVPTAALTRVPEAGEPAQQDFADRVDDWLLGEGHPADVHGLPVDTGFRGRGRGRGWAGLLDRALDGQDVTGFIEAALEPHDEAGAPCECRALLAALLRAPLLRDLVMLQAAWGHRFGRHVALHTIPADPGGPMDEAVWLAFAGGDFARPDADRAARAAATLTALAGCQPQPDRAPALTAAAWLHWSIGHGSAAGRLLDLAFESDPTYGLAEILSARLAHGHLPEWAFRATPGTRAGRRWVGGGAAGRARTRPQPAHYD